ncbi:nitronate monooxygenase [Bacteriovoracaceae bacterium]|nr:nitronate monooxygenase [Bacteriovoracaceae bacterium]|tara:strand:- start:32609 stop:33586 length:978 start_codon:yes stop_codon:yes gene_type:complete
MNTWITETFKIKYPIIMAPMFLVSNKEMLFAAAEAGITGCVPALNWRTPEEFEEAMKELKEKCPCFGVNLIVNKSNVSLEKQIKVCEKYPPQYIITSLGSPKEVIKRLQPLGVKIICDVVDVEYALKVQELGADAIIAVNSGAGGHAGPTPASILVPMLLDKCTLPVISAGGVGTGAGLLSVLAMGAEGASIGSPFIAVKECGVNDAYKQAIVDYGAKDIALTTKVSGTPCTVIKTPYVEKIGLEQNFLESFLNKNKKIKKYAKMLTYYKGMKLLESAAFGATYKSVWCAGPSIEFVNKQESTKEIVDRLMTELSEAKEDLLKRV